ncbi:hypothetical protein MRX96_028580 [Rhipicephalus microplus]
MTKETCEATIMTTRSTVALIQHLLDNNFHYVLIRALNSDPVESLFSCFRQFNGGNDRVDARTAVFTAEKLLKLAVPDDLELAPLVYLAGYIARACEEKFPCGSCKVLLQETKPCGSVYDLVKKIDNGQLRYPNMEIVKICKLACDFPSNIWLPALHYGVVRAAFSTRTRSVMFFLKKLLRPLQANWAGNVSATVQRLIRLAHKPLFRKVLRL